MAGYTIERAIALFIDWAVGTFTPGVKFQSISVVTTPVDQTVGVAVVTPFSANEARKRFHLINRGTTIIYVAYGQNNPSSTTYHFSLKPCTVAEDGTGGVLIDNQWTGEVRVVSSAAGGKIALAEFS
jgi:hypothetical protein